MRKRRRRGLWEGGRSLLAGARYRGCRPRVFLPHCLQPRTSTSILFHTPYGVVLGISRATVRSPAICAKIWFRLVDD